MRYVMWMVVLAVSVSAVAAEPGRMVEAWRRSGKHQQYPTMTLADVPAKAIEAGRKIPLDEYGGRTDRQYEATGFFRAQKIDGRWWLIDPKGHPFIHKAVNSVTLGSSKNVRAAMAEKFGDKAAWAKHTAKLLHEAGFNGTGNWTDNGAIQSVEPRMVYTLTWRFMHGYGRKRGGITMEPGHVGYPNRCIFVFDPEFETYVDEYAKQLAETKDAPWLLGHFSDNEMPFSPDLLDRYLKLDAKDPGYLAAKNWLTARQGEFDKSKITAEDRSDFLRFVADRYYRLVSQAIRKYDPNHIYLGSRLHGRDVQLRELFETAGKYCEVVAVNLYNVWTPGEEVKRLSEWSGRPLIISEWYAKGADTGMKNLSGAGWTVPTQADRGAFYQNFTLGLMRSGVCVGWHWFKYLDNDPENLKTDPSNRDSNKGIVNIKLEPYQPLIDAMKGLNDAAYGIMDQMSD
ncbi:hypothetical protein HED60_18445 [Planctomycetales bacterium ZRK34]|nr:hypothetical protein HED60_18445 [Planctomycetales bacterium ZRK34]